MTLGKAIQRLKELQEYVEGEILSYAQIGVDATFWIKDAHALNIAVEALDGMRQQDTECDFCRTQALENPGSHDFRVVDDALYFFDSQFGWEGMGAAYCPKCGRKLYARKEGTP